MSARPVTHTPTPGLTEWLADRIEHWRQTASESHKLAANSYGAGYDAGYLHALIGIRDRREETEVPAALLELLEDCGNALTDSESSINEDRSLSAHEQFRTNRALISRIDSMLKELR